MPQLIVLNGPPAVGKSTIARQYVAGHPLALRIDIDEIRDALGAWRQAAPAAGLRARALATAMARDHLCAGHDVVVAQLYGQPDHLDQLANIASELGAVYREIVLMTDVASTLERFSRRGGLRLEEALQAPGGLESIAALHERVENLTQIRPQSLVVHSITGDAAATYEAVLDATRIRPE